MNYVTQGWFGTKHALPALKSGAGHRPFILMDDTVTSPDARNRRPIPLNVQRMQGIS